MGPARSAAYGGGGSPPSAGSPAACGRRSAPRATSCSTAPAASGAAGATRGCSDSRSGNSSSRARSCPRLLQNLLQHAQRTLHFLARVLVPLLRRRFDSLAVGFAGAGNVAVQLMGLPGVLVGRAVEGVLIDYLLEKCQGFRVIRPLLVLQRDRVKQKRVARLLLEHLPQLVQ